MIRGALHGIGHKSAGRSATILARFHARKVTARMRERSGIYHQEVPFGVVSKTRRSG